MERRITHTLLSLILAFTICAAPFVDAKRAEAIAPAIPAAAAAGALAAELGISVEALMTGLVAITAAGTGVYLMSSSDGASTLSDAEWRHLWGTGSDTTNPGYTENWGTDYEKYKLGNGKSWDELTNDEQAQWGTPAQYVQSQWLAYLLQNDLIQETGNGGFEPTPEPDPETDPEGNSRWNKSRNTLTALGVGGAAVALGDAVGWLGDVIGTGIHDFLFGSGNTVGSGLGLLYTNNVTVDNLPVVFKSYSVNATVSDSTGTFPVTNSSFYFINAAGNDPIFQVCQDGITPTLTLSINSSTWRNAQIAVPDNKKTGTIVIRNGEASNYAGHYSTIYATNIYGNTGQVYLNANYGGTYQFSGGAIYSDGRFTDTTGVVQDLDYGQMVDTPQDLAESVVNNDNRVWNNYINNATNDAPEGQKKAVVIPNSLDNPSYDDFVKDVNDEDITPIPDNEPLPNPDDPNPPQPPDVDFENDFTHRVNELLSNPFDQLFPFCLIGDMRDFFFIIMGQPQLAQRVDTSNMLSTQSETPINELNGIHTLVIPLNDWGLNDVENIEFDLDPIHDVGHYVRLIITIVLIMGIVMFSMNFFLKRGA